MNLSRMLMLVVCLALCSLLPGAEALAADAAVKLQYRTESNISYYDAAALSRADAYQKDQCKLDVYFPTGTTGYATIVWLR